jgi:Dyp-type peroxidase family
MKFTTTSYLASTQHSELEKNMIASKRRQAGISFPAPRKQDYSLIVRLDIIPTDDKKSVSQGLKRLCTLFEKIDREIIEIEDTSNDEEMYMYPLTKFNFTATVGFGKTFFKKLNLMKKCPKNLHDLPIHYEIGDQFPYTLLQTDMILQLASSNHALNKMVLQNDQYLKPNEGLVTKDLQYLNDTENGLDITDAIKGWAKITDVHFGFHRADGRNLMGFYDGISNPHRLTNNNIWICGNEGEMEFEDGTFMVFQKIEHNLGEWGKLSTQEQEKWVGRSKATGLLLGTLSPDEENKLVSELHSTDSSKQEQAKDRLSKLIDEQRDPIKNFFDSYDIRYLNINKNCPESSHARRTNPRKKKSGMQGTIFRRGFLYMEDDFVEYPKTGILFISFQNDIEIFIEMKRNMAQHVNTHTEMKEEGEKKNSYGNGISAKRSFDTLTLGGGYYYIPAIPGKRISEIGQHFF